MDAVWPSIVAWAAAHRAELAAIAIAALATLPFLALRTTLSHRRRREIRGLAIAEAAKPALFALRAAADKRAATAHKALYANQSVITIAMLPLEDRIGTRIADNPVAKLGADIGALLGRNSGLQITQIRYHRDAAADVGTVTPIEADLLLEGSVELVQAGQRPAVRVAIQMIERATGDRVFSDAFEADLRRLAAMEDEISESIAGSLGSTMSAAPPLPGTLDAATQSMAAWALVQRAEEALRSGISRQRMDESVRLYDHAARIDPGYADAKASLVSALSLRVLFLTSLDRQEDLARARAALEAARIAGPETLYTAIGAGLYALAGGDPAGAKAAFARADDLVPGLPAAAIYGATAALYAGERPDMSPVRTILDETSEQALRALARYALGLDLMQRGDHDAAIAEMGESVAGVRAFHMAWLLGGMARALTGDIEKARGVFAQARRVMGPASDDTVRQWVETVAATPERASAWRAAFAKSWR